MGLGIATVLVLVSLFMISANHGQASIEHGKPVANEVGMEVATIVPADVPTPLAELVPSLQGPVSQPQSAAAAKPSPSPAGVPSISRPSAEVSPLPAITTLADGSSDAVLTYSEAGRKTVDLKIPSNWNIASARLDISGEPYVTTAIDQKNEAPQHDNTWGVRAQQFRPAGDVLTSVDLFLAHVSSNPGKLTVEVREDDGHGYPSATVLASVSKAVAVGGYRWEEFDFPQVQVTPGQPYWIVNYVKPLGEVAYPNTPSVGDYGYYLGMSLNDAYPQGDSADFLTYSTGPLWEKFDSRKGWDLMFRTRTQQQHFPSGVQLSLGSEEKIRWSYPPELQSTVSSGDLSAAFKDYLLAGQGSGEEDIQVPLSIESASPGVIRISNVQITGAPR